MSHVATVWAIQQRGLAPVTKLVLWHLADCHNRHTKRCDPCQGKLAQDCEIARSTLNRHLGMLEERGLIARIQRSNSKTKTKMSTFYVLHMPEDEPAKAMSQNRIRDGDKPMSQNRTWKKSGAMSQKQPIPCPTRGT